MNVPLRKLVAILEMVSMVVAHTSTPSAVPTTNTVVLRATLVMSAKDNVSLELQPQHKSLRNLPKFPSSARDKSPPQIVLLELAQLATLVAQCLLVVGVAVLIQMLTVVPTASTAVLMATFATFLNKNVLNPFAPPELRSPRRWLH